MKLEELTHLHCEPRKGAEHALDKDGIESILQILPGWETSEEGKAIVKDFSFRDFHQTLEFIAALGFVANHQDHHPDIEAGYGHCKVRFSTHDVGGLSMNDFICAARVEAFLS